MATKPKPASQALDSEGFLASDAAKKAERAKRFGLVPARSSEDVGAADVLKQRAKRFGFATADAVVNGGGKDSKPPSEPSVAIRDKGKGKRKYSGKAEQRSTLDEPVQAGKGKAKGKGSGKAAQIDEPPQDGKGKAKGKGKGAAAQRPRENNVQDYTDHVLRLAVHDANVQNRLRSWVRDKIMNLQRAGSLKSCKWDEEPLPNSEELRKMGWVKPVAQAPIAFAHNFSKGDQKGGRSTPYETLEYGRSSSLSQGPAAPSSYGAPPFWHHPPPAYGHAGYAYPPFYGAQPPPAYHPPPLPHGAPVYSDYQHAPPAAAAPSTQPTPGQPSLPAEAVQQGTPTRNHNARLRSRSPLVSHDSRPPPAGFRVRMSNVPPELTAIDFVDALKEICKQRIESVDVLRNSETGVPTGETLIVFSSREDACNVVANYHRGGLNGRLLEVILEEEEPSVTQYSYRAAPVVY